MFSTSLIVLTFVWFRRQRKLMVAPLDAEGYSGQQLRAASNNGKNILFWLLYKRNWTQSHCLTVLQNLPRCRRWPAIFAVPPFPCKCWHCMQRTANQPVAGRAFHGWQHPFRHPASPTSPPSDIPLFRHPTRPTSRYSDMQTSHHSDMQTSHHSDKAFRIRKCALLNKWDPNKLINN